MRLRVRYKHWLFKLLLRGYRGITLYPFILFRDSRERVSDELFRHELAHVYQVRSLGWFRFYGDYLLESFRHGYYLNKYEIEARGHQHSPLTAEERALKDGA